MYLKDVYVCNRLRQYEYLVTHGIKPISTREDAFYPNRTVWLFKTADALKYLNEQYEERTGIKDFYKLK